MSNYKRTYWKDSPETDISAERLNNMEEGIEKLYENVSNPNLFINGNFQIWSNGEEFTVAINDDGTYGGYVVTADRWTVGAWSSNTAYVYKTDKGLTFSRLNDASIDVFQVLEEETLKSILGKPLTMSYAIEDTAGVYQEYTRNITLDDNIEIEPFNVSKEYFCIELQMGCTLIWAKLEVGEVATPCVSDSKDAIICKLEKRMVKTYSGENSIVGTGGWVTFTVTFPEPFTEIPFVSVMQTSLTSNENIALRGIDENGFTYEVYAPTKTFEYQSRWMAIGY